MRRKLSEPGILSTLRDALALNSRLYEAAHHTPSNYRLAFSIVILATLSHMVGNAVILLINRATLPVLLLVLILDGLSVIAGYYLWTFIVWKVAQWMKPIDPTYRDLLSPIGFAYAPQILNVLTLIPLLGRPIELILAVWSLLAVIVAVRQGLDTSPRRAALLCLLSWIPVQTAIGVVQLTLVRLNTG